MYQTAHFDYKQTNKQEYEDELNKGFNQRADHLNFWPRGTSPRLLRSQSSRCKSNYCFYLSINSIFFTAWRQSINQILLFLIIKNVDDDIRLNTRWRSIILRLFINKSVDLPQGQSSTGCWNSTDIGTLVLTCIY